MTPPIRLHHGDLPPGLELGDVIAIDSETMGLNPHRDRLCLVQLWDGKGDIHLVKFSHGALSAPNLVALLADRQRLKLFHFARFDIAAFRRHLNVVTQPLFCTKIASKLVRTYTDRHGLKDLVKELLEIDLSKQQQSSDWGAETLAEPQLQYAASDVLHLHRLRAILEPWLQREGRRDLAEACFRFLPARAELDLLGWGGENDVLEH